MNEELIIKKLSRVRILGNVLRTRQFSNKIYLDLEIAVLRNISLVEAHEIAEQVHGEVEHQFPNIKHIMIHVNPA